MDKDAIISCCGTYRYSLSRIWKPEGFLFAYIGINPSTADANIDDATVRKWIGFTERNGGRGFLVGNVFALRSTDVKELLRVTDPVGPDNHTYLKAILQQADVIVPCWGNEAKIPKSIRAMSIEKLWHLIWQSGKPVKIFGVTKNGSPKHPLMLGYNTKLSDVTPPQQDE